MTTILRADATDVRVLARLIAQAFAPLQACAWLVPIPAVREEILAAHFEILVDHATRWGQVDTTADRDGVAVWFPRGTQPPPAPENYHQRLRAACGPHAGRFHQLDELFDQHHPTEPHHHLAFLAVTPEQQGEGIGADLLRHHHALLDTHGTPARLDAANRRARALYLRHGYRDHGEPFALPNGALFWPMRRPARPAAPTPIQPRS